MKRSAGYMACALLLSTTASAHATTIAAEGGEVLVNYGSGYLPVLEPGTEVFPGTQIMVRPGATAVVFYKNCTVRLGDKQVWTVERAPPCPPGSDSVDLTGPSGSAGESNTALIVGGLVVGGGIIAAIALSGGDGDSGNNPNNGIPISGQ